MLPLEINLWFSHKAQFCMKLMKGKMHALLQEQDKGYSENWQIKEQ